VIADRRAPDAPPCDSLAEAIVLHHLLIHPDLIGTVDLAPLLVFKEHQWCWQAMVRAHMRYPEMDCGDFWQPWLAELERLAPSKSLDLWDLLTHAAGEDQSARVWEEHGLRGSQAGVMAAHAHDFNWWVERLKSITEARRGVQAAQRVAERWWRAPDEPFSGADALAILEKAVPPRRPSLAERVLHV
jgi:hypothetical protein